VRRREEKGRGTKEKGRRREGGRRGLGGRRRVDIMGFPRDF
jgi:hypothetical protein